MHFSRIILLALLLVGCDEQSQCNDEAQNNNIDIEDTRRQVSSHDKDNTAPHNTEITRQTYILNKGDTLTHLLRLAGFSFSEIYALADAIKPLYDFKKIQSHTQFDVIETPNSKTIRFAASFAQVINAKLVKGNWEITQNAITTQTEKISRSFAINHSLYQAASDAEVPNNVINSAILAMSHFVDFQREIRQGDQITLNFNSVKLTQDAHLFSTFSNPQQLVAISFINQGKNYELYHYQDTFYFKDGKLAQSFLMKTPLNGARLSSNFGKRKHPILGYTRQHKGIDFSAPVGTPIMAAGKGKILKASYSRSFGNRVLIDHGNGYRTLYAHLKGFAKGIKHGARVSQGQTIGFLGNTGLSSARHLHYEVHKNGKVINPLKMKQPSNIQLTGDELHTFKNHISTIDKRYATLLADSTTDDQALSALQE